MIEVKIMSSVFSPFLKAIEFFAPYYFVLFGMGFFFLSILFEGGAYAFLLFGGLILSGERKGCNMAMKL